MEIFLLSGTSRGYSNVGKHRLMKQRSPEWFSTRKKFSVTGSTLHKGLGLDGLKKQKEHIRILLGEVEEPAISEELQEALNHGTDNEPNALATLAAIVISYYFPNFFSDRGGL